MLHMLEDTCLFDAAHIKKMMIIVMKMIYINV